MPSIIKQKLFQASYKLFAVILNMYKLFPLNKLRNKLNVFWAILQGENVNKLKAQSNVVFTPL